MVWYTDRAAPYSAASNLLVDLKEAMRQLSVGKTKLNDLANAGLLDRKHIGRRSVITMASIHEFVSLLAG
jgi:hypothetical protein